MAFDEAYLVPTSGYCSVCGSPCIQHEGNKCIQCLMDRANMNREANLELANSRGLIPRVVPERVERP